MTDAYGKDFIAKPGISLADALPIEQARVRDLIEEYMQVPNGKFAAAMMRSSLEQAERSAASGDVVAMLRSYEDLSSYK